MIFVVGIIFICSSMGNSNSNSEDLESEGQPLRDISLEDLAAIINGGESKTSSQKSLNSKAPPVQGNYNSSRVAQAVIEIKKRGKSKTIYGHDDRRDWWEIKDQKIKKLAKASVAFFNEKHLSPLGSDGKYSLTYKNDLKGQNTLCPSETENFFLQRTGAFCSGVLIGENTILTAAHCVAEASQNEKIPRVENVRYVFGFIAPDKDSLGNTTFESNQVYAGADVEYYNNLEDWAIITLDTSEVNKIPAKPVTEIQKDKISDFGKVFVIGYPAGLPLKYAPNSWVRDNTPDNTFTADLDTFGGNSGSGVYNQDTNSLVGILTEGEPDFIANGSCNIVHICPRGPVGSNCEGEGVTRITQGIRDALGL
ncbi:MAG: serine protease [Bacteroidetes bacterium]|nr:serine protease [Bacteroidota bacterium]